MKTRKIWLIAGVILFIGLSNFTGPVYLLCTLIGEGGLLFRGTAESYYITKDKKYVHGGGWLKDTLSNPYYKRYVLLYPRADRTLYRIHPIQLWKFWRWHEYLTQEKWKQPYLKVDELEAYHILHKFWNTFRGYEGPLPHQDSVLARNPFNQPITKGTTANP